MYTYQDDSERILAIDFGEKRIGIAISDPLKIFPIPLKTLQNDKNLWENFKEILKKYKIIKVIIGYPLKEDGSKSHITLKVEKFVKDFENRFDYMAELVDERYSSSIAWEHILEGVKSKKKRRDKSLLDRNAAAVILGEYLNNQS